MELTTIRGETRQPGGRHANERLRRRGLVPAVIYGHNEPPESVAISQHDLVLALGHAKRVVQLDVAGQQSQYLLKEVQYDHLQKDPIHVDLVRVSAGERVRVKVALQLKGDAKGVHEGGELVQLLTDLEVECPLAEIPEVLYHKVNDLELGQALHVKDISLPPNVTARHAPDDIIAVVRTKRGDETEAPVVAATPVEGGAEPEVIGKGPKEKGEEEAAEK
jgi:large subunit ribosomal protein L25